jgi:hypothetical protein
MFLFLFLGALLLIILDAMPIPEQIAPEGFNWREVQGSNAWFLTAIVSRNFPVDVRQLHRVLNTALTVQLGDPVVPIGKLFTQETYPFLTHRRLYRCGARAQEAVVYSESTFNKRTKTNYRAQFRCPVDLWNDEMRTMSKTIIEGRQLDPQL